MEACKCPKCGEESQFVEHVEKWYCYNCNEYVEAASQVPAEEPEAAESPPASKPPAIADELRAMETESKAPCGKCGGELQEIDGGKMFCFSCESYEAGDDPKHAQEAVITPEVRPEPIPEKKAEPAPEKPRPVAHDAQDLLDQATKPPEPSKPSREVPLEKPAGAPPEVRPKPVDVKMCPGCESPLKYIEKYQRYYCYNCRKYAPKEEPETQAVTAPKVRSVKTCPECGSELKFVEKYNEHYCYTCRKYPLRATKAPAKPAAQPAKAKLSCPKCGEALKMIEKYNRYYCYACKEYAPKGYVESGAQNRICPHCNEQMKYIPQYKEWYCYRCKKYSLRPSKPVLLM